jgi:hypothetical protein
MSTGPMSRYALLAVAAVAAAMALPAAATASEGTDLALTQSASSTLVKKGETVTLTITVENRGSEANLGGAGVQMIGLGGGDDLTDNPYQSVTTTQGSCADESVGRIAQEFCRIGHVAPGATVRITAVVQMNETMNHDAGLAFEGESGPSSGEYSDANGANNGSFLKISASAPPLLTGSAKIKLPVLPKGCVSGDFPLKIVVAAPQVKKVAASLFLGFDRNGEGQEWQRVAHGPRLQATVPGSQMLEYHHPFLNTTYQLKIKARLKGGRRLTRTVGFQLC